MNLVTVVAAVVVWAGFAIKAAQLRHRRDRAEILFSLGALAAAVALTVLNPWGSLGVEVLLGRPQVAQLVGDSAAVTACWLGLLFLEELRAGRLAAPLVWLYTAPLLVVLAIMWVAFVTMPTSPRAAGPWTGYAGGPPGPALSHLAYFAYPGWTCGTVLVRGLGWSRVVQRPSLQVALMLTSAGALLGIPYVALEVEGVLTDGRFAAMNLELLTGVVCVLLCGGATFPSWARRIRFDDLGFSEWWALQRLFGLWRLLRRARPEIALPPEPSRLGSLIRLREAKWRLRRLVVESRDALLLLHVRWPDSQPSVSELEAEVPLPRGADLRRLAAILALTDGVGGARGLQDEVRSLRRLAATRPARR